MSSSSETNEDMQTEKKGDPTNDERPEELQSVNYKYIESLENANNEYPIFVMPVVNLPTYTDATRTPPPYAQFIV